MSVGTLDTRLKRLESTMLKNAEDRAEALSQRWLESLSVPELEELLQVYVSLADTSTGGSAQAERMTDAELFAVLGAGFESGDQHQARAELQAWQQRFDDWQVANRL